MFEFEQTDYGLKLTIRGALDPAEVARLKAGLDMLLATQDGPFSALVDGREFIPVEHEIAAVLQHCEEMAMAGGMQRMAIILKSPVVKGHVQQIAHLSGSASISRYIDSSKIDNAEQVALDWLVDGIEPEATEDTEEANEATADPNQIIHSER